jgi:hypothetical protein
MKALKRLPPSPDRSLEDQDQHMERVIEVRRRLRKLGFLSRSTSQPVRRRIERIVHAFLLNQPFPGLRPLSPEERSRWRSVIDRLNHDDPEARESATQELRDAGEEILPLLAEAARSEDRERAERAGALLAIIPDAKPAPREDRTETSESVMKKVEKLMKKLGDK